MTALHHRGPAVRARPPISCINSSSSGNLERAVTLAIVSTQYCTDEFRSKGSGLFVPHLLTPPAQIRSVNLQFGVLEPSCRCVSRVCPQREISNVRPKSETQLTTCAPGGQWPYCCQSWVQDAPRMCAWCRHQKWTPCFQAKAEASMHKVRQAFLYAACISTAQGIGGQSQAFLLGDKQRRD